MRRGSWSWRRSSVPILVAFGPSRHRAWDVAQRPLGFPWGYHIPLSRIYASALARETQRSAVTHALHVCDAPTAPH
eukprot:2787045-Pyramimonas_sp.AAC.1